MFIICIQSLTRRFKANVRSNLMRPRYLADIHISPLTVTEILKAVLPQIEPDLHEGAIVSIEETEYRVRKLPIS